MAEIVGLASAITALAALGFKLANGISDLAEELGTIGSQLRSVATDTKAVALVLHELKKHIKSTKNITKSALEIAHEIIAQCQVDIEDLDRCIQPFFIRDEEPRTLGWIKRMQWLFAKSKLATRKAALDSLKLTISMYIAALGFIDGDDTEEYMQIEMKHLVAQCKSTKGTFLDAERHDRAAEETFLAHEYTSFDLQLEGSKENGNEAFRPESEEVDGSDQSLAKTRDNELNSGAIGNRESINDNYSRRTDFQVIETISDDQLVKIGEHLRIQRITSSFALVVLRQGSMTPQANTGSPKQSAFEPAHRPVRRHASPEETDNQTTTSRSGRSATGSQLFDRADDGEILGSSSASDSDAAPSRVSQVPDDSKDKESYQESRSRTGTSTSRKSATRQSRSSQPGNERRWTRPATREQNSNLNSETPHPIRDANYAFQPQEFIHPQYSYMPHPQGYPFDSAGRQSNYYPYQSQQGYGHQFPTPSPFAATSTMPSPDATQQDPEKLKLEAEIRAFKAMQEKEKAAEKQRQIEMQIRKDAEEKFHHRMQEMRLAQDEAKREIERAKREAERAARERLETEKKAEEERQRNYAEAMHRAEQNARIKFEAEMKAAEERRKQEEEARRRAEEAARIRLEAAIKAEAEAKAEAEKRSRTGLKKFFSS